MVEMLRLQPRAVCKALQYPGRSESEFEFEIRVERTFYFYFIYLPGGGDGDKKTRQFVLLMTTRPVVMNRVEDVKKKR